MAAPMKIRAQLKGDTTDIKILMAHPMKALSTDKKTGAVVPSHNIEDFTVEVGGKVVVQSQIGPAISTNPVFGFKVKGAKVGDKVVAKWKDNHGETRSDEAAIA